MLLFCFFSVFFLIKGQNSSKEFKIRYESFIKGDIKIIGNNIINRDDKKNNANVPYDERSAAAHLNDEFNMQYIDVDDDSTTFSSSSASFSFEGKIGSKIVYAGLYWSGTYPYNSGVLKGKDYEPKDTNRELSSAIMLKLPARKDYVHLTGELIFDGINDDNFKGIAPYVYYTNVTHLLKNSVAEGEYTVANVKAATGQIAGGSSAGWALVLVYENSESNVKKIVTYDGFSSISNEAKSFVFTGFKTPEADAFKTRIMGVTLEGDYNMAGDQVKVSVPGTDKSVGLSSAVRLERNFFNSSITDNDNFIMSRNPASKNTLGFDIFKIDVKNENQAIIPNNATSLELTYSKSLDRYYLYLTALEIESNPTEAIVERVTKVTKINTSEINKGFYIVVGVFLGQANVKKRVDEMKELGYDPKVFDYKEQLLNYIYIDKVDTHEEALKKIEEIRKNTQVPDPWILDIQNYLE